MWMSIDMAGLSFYRSSEDAKVQTLWMRQNRVKKGPKNYREPRKGAHGYLHPLSVATKKHWCPLCNSESEEATRVLPVSP